jgi:hypothetical protein
MTTIDQLPAATAVSGADLLMVEQSGTAVKASQAQLVAGLQPTLAVAQNQLLGRASPGTGAPETIALGANLALSGGTLSAQTLPLNLTTLPAGATPAAADLVALGQGGRNVAVPYSQFLAGISPAGSVDVSGATVLAAGAPLARPLSAIAADAVPLEAFGAKGDGVSDDTAAFAAAVAAGVPLRLGPKTYLLAGQFTIATPGVTLHGVAGVTTLKRNVQAGSGAWIAVQADNFRADGIIFDANGSAVTVQSWGVQVESACLHSDFHRCAFRNAYGSSLGCGLVFQSSNPTISEHVVRDCEFTGNAAHGLWVQACVGVQVAECRAWSNAAYGITVDYNDPTFATQARLVSVTGCRAWANQRGISVGNYNATNTTPAVWGNANPDAIGLLVANNICHDNTIYGIAAAGQQIAVQNNLLSNNGTTTNGGAGILANVSYSALTGNTVTGSAAYGIDCGGSLSLDVRANAISGHLYGINCGGGQFVRAEGNSVQGFSVAGFCVANVETDGNGVNFNQACSDTSIAGNWISMNGTATGVWLRDGPQLVAVTRNHFVGTSPIGNCLWADTDSVIIEGNRYNFLSRIVANPTSSGGVQTLTFPDIADSVMVRSAAAPIQSMISARQAQTAGTIAFLRITSPGTGYTRATISIGGPGSGAIATAFISNGSLIGALVVAPGSGYGPVGAQIPTAINGDGSGAQAIAFAAPPLPEERRLRIRCDCAVTFATTGSSPPQQTWTNSPIAQPAASDIDWTVTWGEWRASSPAAADTLATPAQLVAPSEPVGCTSTVGRGSPLGVITANPGSDWRNLNGGAGSTLWIKQTGTDSSGWIAVA